MLQNNLNFIGLVEIRTIFKTDYYANFLYPFVRLIKSVCMDGMLFIHPFTEKIKKNE